MTGRVPLRCQALAIVAWLLCLAWFYIGVIASWGGVVGGVLLWLLPAWFLLQATLAWWARSGAPLPSRAAARVRGLFRAFAVSSVGYYVGLLVLGVLVGDRPWFETGIEWTSRVLTPVWTLAVVALSAWAAGRTLWLRQLARAT
jgi:hypothetical protein